MKIQDQELNELLAKYQEHLECYHFLRYIDYNVAMHHREVAKCYQERIAKYNQGNQQ